MSKVYQPSMVELVGLPGVGASPAPCGECKKIPVGEWLRLVEEAAPDNGRQVVFCACCWDTVFPLLVKLSEYMASGKQADFDTFADVLGNVTVETE